MMGSTLIIVVKGRVFWLGKTQGQVSLWYDHRSLKKACWKSSGL